jgi:hypothetical protein
MTHSDLRRNVVPSIACYRAGYAAIAIFGLLGCNTTYFPSSPSKSNSTAESKTAPAHLLDLDGQKLDVLKFDCNVITVFVFTRTDCPISNRCAPEIRRLHETYQARGVEFFLVYVDPMDKPDEIRRHLQEYDYRCRAIRDPKHELVAYCEATTTPEAVVFAKDGAMSYRGRVDNQYAELGNSRAQPTTHDLADAIDSVIQGRPVAVPRTKAIGCMIADLRE